jgi:hypothetical protein
MKKHVMLVGAVLLSFISVLSYAQAPASFVNLPLVPDATEGGGPQFTHSKWHRFCFELSGELEWRCAGDAVY